MIARLFHRIGVSAPWDSPTFAILGCTTCLVLGCWINGGGM